MTKNFLPFFISHESDVRGATGNDELSKPFSLLIGFGIGAKCGGCGLTEAAAEADEEPS